MLRRQFLYHVTSVAGAAMYPRAVQATDVAFLCAIALRQAMEVLIPDFQRETSHTIKVSYDTIGANAERVRKGDPADLAIVSPQQWDELQKQGKLTTSKVTLGRIGMGVFVKKGVAKPDVSSVEAFRRTFLNARSVSVPVGTGGPVSEYSIRLFERLGIAEVIKAKNVAVDLGTEYPLAVARGDAEVGLTQMSVILATEGVDLAGPVPDEIQNYTIYVVAVSKNSKAPEAVQSFVAFLTSPKVRAVLKSKGLE